MLLDGLIVTMNPTESASDDTNRVLEQFGSQWKIAPSFAEATPGGIVAVSVKNGIMAFFPESEITWEGRPGVDSIADKLPDATSAQGSLNL